MYAFDASLYGKAISDIMEEQSATSSRTQTHSHSPVIDINIYIKFRYVVKLLRIPTHTNGLMSVHRS